MNPLERLDAYLRRLERWLRLNALTRGAALTACAALAGTLVVVLFANSYAFSAASMTAGRVLLFLSLALALCFGVCLPWLKVNRRTAARWLERRFPEFEQRLLTFAERRPTDESRDPFLVLLAADTAIVADAIPPARVTPPRRIVAFLSAAAAAAGCLLWLIVAGPGFLGYGASLLWAGPPRPGMQPFYDIRVSPGDRTVRRGADQLVTAQPIGMQPSQVHLFARYRGASKWESAIMQPASQGPGYQFVFAGIPETAEYYAEAGGVRSKTYTLTVIDLAAIKKIRVTYHYPSWTGMKDAVEDPGGDLRAVEGTEAELAVLTDRPLHNGMLALDDRSRAPLAAGEGNWVHGRIAIQKDGLYHIAANDRGQEVRLSEDFFIEARKASPPVVRVVRPNRDAKVTPIEEMTVGVEAEDDFALQDLSLHYAVNGGPEKTVPLLKQKGARRAEGGTTLSLEDFHLVPGDVVSLYASARNARSSASTDMMFIEAQPFEREYSQAQQMGGGQDGGMGGDQDENRISARQKEIIAATWNEIRDKKDKGAAGDDGKFLSGVQGKLRDQARSLARRMASRELAGANDEFNSFSHSMNAAAEAMQQASDKLKSQAWKDALPSEQKALQNLLRAEATFRQIQVAFGQRGGGGGGSRGAGRDLENLFDLELDTEKNQYEAGRQAGSAEQRARDLDDALQKLEQLARRQQELADQAGRNEQSFEQRWQQERLRREAEDLQRQMEQLTRGQGSQQSSGQQSAGRSLHEMAGRTGAQQQIDPRVQRALERLEQATRDMRGNPGSANDTQARRAAERLEEARQLLRGLRSQQSSDRLGNVTSQAERLAARQRDFAGRLQQAYPGPAPETAGLVRRRAPWLNGPEQDKAEKLAEEKQQLANDYQELERQLQDAVRAMAGSQRAASSKARDALGEAQKNELGMRLKNNAEYIRRGLGAYAAPREAPITEGLDKLAEQLRGAQAALDKGGKDSDLERALSGVERLRASMERAAQGGSRASDPGSLPPPGARFERGDIDRAFTQGLRDLNEIRRSLQGLPELSRDVQELIGEMQRFDPRRGSGNSARIDQLASQLLPAIEQLELQLRRSMDQGGGSARAGSNEPVPPGYAEAVAEYFRRLSKAR